MNIGQLIIAGLAAAGTILESLKGAGVNLGSVGNDALTVIDQSEVDLANYAAGQAVPLGTVSIQGKPGTILVVANGGPAASSLGL